jgi:hypothetical protein
MRCAGTLYQFGRVHQDFFPNGLENAKKGEGWNVEEPWPPPKPWSWRLAGLPFLEQNNLYRDLHRRSEGFKIPCTLSKNELSKLPELKEAVGRMPSWLTLERWKKEAGKTIYRRVLIKDRPDLFVIVESSELVPWHEAGDELEFADGKPLPNMGGNFPNGFFALCGDGRVRFLPSTLSEKELRKALITGKGVRPLREAIKEWEEDIQALDFSKRK